MCPYFSKMYRFYCSPQNISSRQIDILDKNELHHLRDVLRLKYQDKVVVLDGNGREFVCEIKHIDKNCAKLDIIERHTFKRDFKLTVACALPKKSKIDFIVEKLTEIGVDKIILLKTERTEVNLKDSTRKIARLTKIAESALKQSGNLFLPQISFLNFKGLLKLKKDAGYDASTPLSINPEWSRRIDLAIIPNLTSDTQNIKDVLEKKSAKNILVAVGPEGDFSENEIGLAKQAGFVSVSLGSAVLKVDTAAIVAAGFIKLFQGQTLPLQHKLTQGVI